MITELHYDRTNTYVIAGKAGALLFDTGWAGSLPLLFKELGEKGLALQNIKYLLVSHYHPDHMGIAQEIANLGVTLVVMTNQVSHLHDVDAIYAKEKRRAFVPIEESKIKVLEFEESTDFLLELGLRGCILPTPGHSDDSISLVLEKEAAFVGDLYPLYELEVHEEPQVRESWEKILAWKPKKVYYGHAKTAVLEETCTRNVLCE